MGVFVPALRLCMVTLNIYETFKTLRTPPPSTRTGRPSVRALSQRKRDMKGCLAIWLIWACYATYERVFDSMVRIFIPFYDEVKSLVILFLIITRARGAEPIFLHVLKPLIKPYSSTLDLLLDVTGPVGDFIYLVLTLPFSLIAPFLPGSSRRAPVEADPAEARRDALLKQFYPSDAGAAPATRRPLRSASDDMGPLPNPFSNGPPTPPPEYTRHSSAEGGPAGDEWRRYPAFPAAYPSTPLPASAARLPDSGRSSRAFPPVAEAGNDDDDDAPFIPPPIPWPADQGPAPPGFRQSLQHMPEPTTPGSNAGWSDERSRGVDSAEGAAAHVVSDIGMSTDLQVQVRVWDVDADGSDEEIEDDFDKTLRTPPPVLAVLPAARRAAAQAQLKPLLIARARSAASAPATAAVSSALSDATGLTSAGGLWSRTASMSASDRAGGSTDEERAGAAGPTVAGRKRPPPPERSDTLRPDVAASSMTRDLSGSSAGTSVMDADTDAGASSEHADEKEEVEPRRAAKKRKLVPPPAEDGAIGSRTRTRSSTRSKAVPGRAVKAAAPLRMRSTASGSSSGSTASSVKSSKPPSMTTRAGTARNGAENMQPGAVAKTALSRVRARQAQQAAGEDDAWRR